MALASRLRSPLIMKLADAGITIGSDPAKEIVVHDDSVYEQVFYGGNLGIGESYVQGKWDSPNLVEVLVKGLKAGVTEDSLNVPYYALKFWHLLTNPQSANKGQNIAKHYNIGNELMQPMLGPEMCYTCGYFGRGARTHDQAQRDKKQLICEKIELKAGQRVLDIGCGFGSFAKHAATEFDASVTGITLSEEQLAFGKEYCRGLNVDLQLMNYLHLLEHFEPHSFDAVISIGMFEHVGPKNYERYMQIARTLVKPKGFVFIHSIGDNSPKPQPDPWINKYVFEGGVLPNASQIAHAYESQGFVMEDWHNFGPDYARTLNAWRENFDKAWPELQLTGKFGSSPDEKKRFYRMWIYYLSACEATFRARSSQLWQIVLSPNGVDPNRPEGPYRSIR